MTSQSKDNVDVLIFVGQVVTLSAGGAAPRRGKAMQDIGVLQESGVAVRGDRIIAVGERVWLENRFSALVIEDHPQACITPGLIDCHTHLVFAGSREKDFYARIAGTSYEEIARQGGGIRESVRQLRRTSKEDLLKSAHRRLHEILEHGTTTCEIKSGYGLTLADEIKTLEVIDTLAKAGPLTVVATFLGAHEVPDEFRQERQRYIDLLCNEMIPEITRRKLAVYCDIFCEAGVFSIEESRKILRCAQTHGLKLKLHVDELAENFGGAALAVELKAQSADHLVMVSQQGIQALGRGETMAVLLPATTFFLAKDRFAPARALIEAQVPVALGSDLNPGSSNTESLQVVMTLAAVKLKMSPEEILTAVTHNAACALGLAQDVGRLESGLLADFIVWDIDDYRKIPYHFGGNRVRQVYKAGKKLVDRSRV